MHKLKYLSISVILAILLSLAGLSFAVSAHPLAATSPTLGAAASYSVLGAETVTNTGSTTMPGDLGVWPGSAVTGFPPGQVGPPGHKHITDGSAKQAQKDTSAAFDFLDTQGCTQTYLVPTDLTGAALGPGVYCAPAFELNGHLDLTGGGGENDVWIFKSAATLTVNSGSSVTGGNPCNVWWREVSSATIGTNAEFIGNIIAYASVHLQTGASLAGRAMALTAAVTLDSNRISDAQCLAAPAPTATSKPTSKPKAKSTNQPSSSSEQTATALAGLPGLPGTGGGAPIQDEDFPWSLVFVGGVSAMALVLGVRAFRRTYRPKA